MRHRAPRTFLGLRSHVLGATAAGLVLAGGAAWATTNLAGDPTAEPSRRPSSQAMEAGPEATGQVAPTESRSSGGRPPTGDGELSSSPTSEKPTGTPSEDSTPTPSPVEADDSPPARASSPTSTEATPSPDDQAPSTSIVSGPADRETARFVFTADEPATFSCSLDGGSFRPCGSPVSFPEIEAGWHTFAVRATDTDGNTDPSPATWRWHSNGQ